MPKISDLLQPRKPYQIRLTDGEKARIVKAARKAGLPWSSWARTLLLDAARTKKKVKKVSSPDFSDDT